MTHPTDDEIMSLAVRYLGEHAAHASTGLHRFARALLAEQARTEPVGHVNMQIKAGCGDGIKWTGWALPHGTPLYAAPLLTHKADAEPSNMVQAERDRCAAIADDEAAIREKAGLTHPEDSPARDRCFAGARAAANVARGIRNGEVLETHKAEDAPSDAELLDSRGNIRSDLKSSAYCVGNEYKPFHPRASHVRPEWRDGWNACFVAAIAQERKA